MDHFITEGRAKVAKLLMMFLEMLTGTFHLFFLGLTTITSPGLVLKLTSTYIFRFCSRFGMIYSTTSWGATKMFQVAFLPTSAMPLTRRTLTT